MALDEKAYTTTSEVQDDLGLDREEEVSYLEGLILAASRQIDKYCHRQFWYASRSERHAPAERIALSSTPVHAITSVTDTETTVVLGVDEYTLEVPKWGLVWLDVAPLTYMKQSPGVIPTHPAATKRTLGFVFTAGYRTPAQTLPVGVTGVDDLPSDIQLAARMMVSDFYANRGSNPRVKRRHLLEAAVWYDQQFRDDQFSSMLASYRRFVQ